MLKKFFSLSKRFISETDTVLTALIAAASIFGVIMVYSTTRYSLEDGEKFSRDALVMAIAAVLGLVVMIIISAIDYEMIMKLWPIIGLFCVALMILTLTIGVAPDARPDAKCWLKFGGTYFQSSELVKIGFVITYSMHLELLKDKINKPLSILLLGVHALVPTALVIRTGDMGSALVFMLMAVGMLYFAGLHWGFFAGGAVLAIAASPLLWMFMLSKYQKNRFLALIKPDEFPDEAYQQIMGKNALGSGGFFGQGLFKGAYTQAGLVPEAKNDMIFTAIGEETGFFGCFVALLLLLFIVLKIIKTGKEAKDFSAQLACYGIAVMIASQVLINVGMCLMILPVIGITLPFFSAGGSSTLCLYIGIGLVFSIYRYNRAREAVNFRLSRISTPFSEF